MRDNKTKKLETILKKWKAPKASVFFEEKVMRSIRERESKKFNFFESLFFKRALIATATIAIIFIVIMSINRNVLIGTMKEIQSSILINVEQKETEIKTNELILAQNPVELNLKDGSKIIMNKDAIIEFKEFNESKKVCKLNFGSILLDVKKRTDQNFIIVTDQGQINVIGTTLLVSADKPITAVSVIKGEVKVKNNKNETFVQAGKLALIKKDENINEPSDISAGLGNSDKYIRAHAVRSIAEIKDKKYTPALVSVLSDVDSLVRTEAAIALGDIADNASGKALMKALNDSDKIVQMQSAISLGKMKFSEAKWKLKELTNDKEPEVRLGAIIALNYFGEKILNVLALLKDLESEDSITRCNAVKLLGKLGDKNIALRISEMAKDKDKEVRFYTIRTLEELKEQKTYPAIINLIKDKDFDVRRKAIQTLSNLDCRKAVMPVLEALKKDETKEVKFSAIRALSNLLDEKDIRKKNEISKKVKEFLNDEDRIIRISALLFLAKIQDKDIQADITKLLKDKDTLVSSAAYLISEKLNAKDFKKELSIAELKIFGRSNDKTTLSVLVRNLKDVDVDIRRATIEAFGDFGDKLYAVLLTEYLNDKDPFIKDAAVKALNKLQK